MTDSWSLPTPPPRTNTAVSPTSDPGRSELKPPQRLSAPRSAAHPLRREPVCLNALQARGCLVAVRGQLDAGCNWYRDTLPRVAAQLAVARVARPGRQVAGDASRRSRAARISRASLARCAWGR